MKIILLLFVITILNNCGIIVVKETARALNIIAEDSKAKAEDKKKNDEDKDEKQYIIDCIKMVVYCD